MSIPDKKIWILLAKHFAGETSSGEETEISLWKKENTALYDKIKNDWNLTPDMKNHFNVDIAWDKLHDRIEKSGTAADIYGKATEKRRFSLYPLRIAASVLLMLAAGIALYFLIAERPGPARTYTAKDAIIRRTDLPDGSAVYLRYGSKLSLSKDFSLKGRNVALKGEAFFEVAADTSDPFVIEVNGAYVRAVGTRFNVSEGEKDRNVKVYVESGKVKLAGKRETDNEIMLDPGYVGIMEGRSIKSEKAPDNNEIAWMTREMRFEDTELTKVLQVLEDVYNVDIELTEPSLGSLRIYGEFTNDPLDEVLEVISTTNNLTVRKKGEHIILSPER